MAESLQEAVDITDSSLNDAFRPILVSYDNRVEANEPATYILESERLNAALLRAARARGSIALLGGHAIASFAIDEHGCSIDLEGGTPLRTPRETRMPRPRLSVQIEPARP